MKKKFVNALVFGALIAASSMTVTSCKDYDGDIDGLRTEITTNATKLDEMVKEKVSNIEKEISALQGSQANLEKAYKEADDALKLAIEKAQNAADAAEAKAVTEAAAAQKAAIAAAQEMVNGALAKLEAQQTQINDIKKLHAEDVAKLLQADKTLTSALETANANIEKAYALAGDAMKKAEANKALIDANSEAITKVTNDLKIVKESLDRQISIFTETLQGLQTNVNKNKADIEAQQAAFNDYKKSMETALNELKDADAKTYNDLKKLIDANLASITKQEEALGKLQTQVNAQQALWEAYATDAAQKVANQLNGYKTEQTGKLQDINDNIVDLQEQITGILGGDVKYNLKDLKDAIEKAQSDINSLGISNIDGLQGALDDLSTLIAGKADASALEAVGDDLTKTTLRVDSLVGALNGYDELVNQVDDIDSRLTTLAGKFGTLPEEYETLQDQLAAMNANINALSTQILSVINVLKNNVLNMISGIIYQGSAPADKVTTTHNLTMAYAVVGGPGATGNPIVFPFENAPNVNAGDYLKKGQYNIHKSAGYIYASINPAEIDITGAKLSLINSLGDAAGFVKLEGAEEAKVILTTRGSDASKARYLWKLPISVTNEHMTSAQWSDAKKAAEARLAISHSYKMDTAYVEANGKITTKSIDRHVLSGFQVVINNEKIEASTVSSSNIEAVGAIDATDGKRFPEMKGTLELTTDKDIYQSYLYIADSEVANALGNSKINHILKGEKKKEVVEFTNVPVSLSNKVIKLRWYVQNYDGTSFYKDISVIFSNPLIENDAMAYTSVPNAAAYITTSKYANIANVKFLASQNKLWTENVTKVTYSIGGEGKISGTAIFVNYLDASGNILFPQNAANTSVQNFPDAGKDITKIKNISLTYASSTVIFNKEVKVTAVYSDKNGATVNTVVYSLTMKNPTMPKYDPVSALFDSDNNVKAWADFKDGKAYFNLNTIFNGINSDYTSKEGANGEYTFRDLTGYSMGDPTKATVPFVNASTHNHDIYVPTSVVNGNDKFRSYTLQLGVNYFGVVTMENQGISRLWVPVDATKTFNLKFYSPIYEALMGDKNNVTTEIIYGEMGAFAGKVFDLKDPSGKNTGGLVFVNGRRDARINKVEVLFDNEKGNNGNEGLISEINETKITAKQGVTIAEAVTEISIQTNLGTDRPALEKPTTLNMVLRVTDKFGLTADYPFTITVKPQGSK